MEEITRPEEIEDNFPEPDPTTYCEPCQSKWKPNRRDLIQAALAVTVIAAGVASTPSVAATPKTLGASIVVNCETQLAQDIAQCYANFPNPRSPVEDILLDACIAGARFDYAACKLAEAAAVVVAALATAAQWIIDNAAAIGTIIIIGVVVIVVVVCITGTGGACAAVAVGAALA